MELNNWSSFFEIFAVLNIGYASFEFFRKIVHQDVFERGKLSNRLSILISEISLYLSEKEEDSKIYKTLYNAKRTVEYEEENIANKEDASKCFIESFKSISLILSLYCIAVLIIGGYQAQEKIAIDLSEKFNCYIFFLAIGTSSYAYIVFFSTLFNKILINEIKSSPIQTILIFVVCSITSLYVLKSFNITMIEIISYLLLTPLIVYALIVLFNFHKIEEYRVRKAMHFFKSLIKYFLDWKVLGLIGAFLLSILLFLIPVIIYFETTNSYVKNVIFDIIILINPVLLYILITIRIYIHHKRFKKAYLILSNEYTPKFENLLDLAKNNGDEELEE